MWSLPWRCMEATWASLRVQCSSLSPSPGWTRWLWVTPTPCVSGRNRNHHAKARTWAPKAPAQPRKLKPLYLTPLRSSPFQLSSGCLSTVETPETNLHWCFPFCLLLWCWWAVLSHPFALSSGLFFLSSAVLREASGIAANFLDTHCCNGGTLAPHLHPQRGLETGYLAVNLCE